MSPGGALQWGSPRPGEGAQPFTGVPELPPPKRPLGKLPDPVRTFVAPRAPDNPVPRLSCLPARGLEIPRNTCSPDTRGGCRHPGNGKASSDPSSFSLEKGRLFTQGCSLGPWRLGDSQTGLQKSPASWARGLGARERDREGLQPFWRPSRCRRRARGGRGRACPERRRPGSSQRGDRARRLRVF